jgi:hypothetical protein
MLTKHIFCNKNTRNFISKEERRAIDYYFGFVTASDLALLLKPNPVAKELTTRCVEKISASATV